MLVRVISWIVVLLLIAGCTQGATSIPATLVRPPTPINSPPPTQVAAPMLITTAGSVCPVTRPNGSQPPGEKVLSPQHHGNGALWTVLPANGILTVRRENDGRLSIKLPWWRGVTGALAIEGHRLDEAPDGGDKFSAHVPDGYGASGFQASGIYFSSEGCWELIGRAGSAELKFVVDVRTGE